ncbi:MAG: signal peptidase II [Thermomonas sp.]
MAMPTIKPNALPWLAVSVLVFALDQWSKAWVLRTLPEHVPVPVIDGFWNWYRTYNTGAAFSFLADAGGWQKWFFVTLAFAICGLMVWMLARTSRRDWRSALPLALVVGGALGNVVDRFLHGHVIDFVQWYVGEHYWPAFNIADSAVMGGAIGIGLFGLLSGKSKHSGR